MFYNKSAWFSSSVPEKCKEFWMMEGGIIRCWETADYLFSQDALCPDTKRIYFSRDYLFNKVTVFHSRLLSACEKRKSFQSVCVGHYVLPPDSVQEEVRNAVGRLIWECDDIQGTETFSDDSENEHSDRAASESISEESPIGQQGGVLTIHPSSNMVTGFVDIGSLPKYSGPLSDFCAGCCRCSHCCLRHT